MVFTDRLQAGLLLASRVRETFHPKFDCVIGLARGGMVLAAVIAHEFAVPLDVLVVKKIPAPSDPELGIGAIAPDHVRSIDRKHAARVGADEAYIKRTITKLESELSARLARYRKHHAPQDIAGSTVCLVDDGAATGITLAAAVRWLRKKGAAGISIALPVVHPAVAARLRRDSMALIALTESEQLRAVGQFYRDFREVTDEDVIQLLTSIHV